MGLGHSPRIVTENLVLLLDAANPRNFNLTAVEVLVVAGGGGGGGGDVGSGGGAGGLIYNSNFAVTPGTQLTVTIGDGGAGSSTYNIDGSNGGNSVFGALTAIGGGGGASWSSGTGQDGGSGGGGVGGSAGGLGTAGQGFAGGIGLGFPDYPQAGGGGAGGAGQNAPSQILAGNGGIGLFFPQFSSVGGNPAGWFAGGGGGGVEAGQNGNSITPGNGGLGGGGNGGRQGGTAIIATAGSPNTGGGGGGTDPGTGGAGGSGIVIVRYQGPQKAIGGTVTSVGGDTIHTFTTSGTFTPLVNTNGSAVLGLSDLSGNRNFGTTANSPTYSSANGGSLSFDGSNDYVNIGIGKGVNQFSADFAVSAWVFRNAGGPTFGNIIGDYYTGSVATTNEWQIMMSSTAQFNFYRVGSGYVIPSTASGYSASQWINVVVSRIGSAISMYANNNLIASTTNSEVFGTATGNLNIGIDGNNSAEPLSANISNVMIYKNKGLTAAEVSQNYNALRFRYGL